MAAKSTLKNMALCLTLVCLVCSAILALVYAVTADPIKAAEQNRHTRVRQRTMFLSVDFAAMIKPSRIFSDGRTC